MLQIGLAPCSPFSVTPELMRDSALLAERLDVRLHTHLAETIDEEEFCAERFGLRTVDYLDSVGWLSDRVWLGHGIHFDDDEISRLGAAGTGIAHCPSSNMRLGSGIARVVELEEAGSPVGLGVDGSASNDASNMIIETRQALLLQRLRYGTERVPVRRALDWGTRGSAARARPHRRRGRSRSASKPTWLCSRSTTSPSRAATTRWRLCCCAVRTGPNTSWSVGSGGSAAASCWASTCRPSSPSTARPPGGCCPAPWAEHRVRRPAVSEPLSRTGGGVLWTRIAQDHNPLRRTSPLPRGVIA